MPQSLRRILKNLPRFLENLPRFWKNVGDFLRNVPCFSIPSAPSPMLLYFQNRSAKNLTMRNDILIFYCYFCHAT